MLKTRLYFLLVLSIGIQFGCDKIEDPHPPMSDFDLGLFPGEPDDYPYPIFNKLTSGTRNALLEDYTGHKCVPCVAAAALASEIEDANPERVVVVGIHASPTGNFQEVDAEHPTDFTTEAGDIYVQEMDGQNFNPLGTTNRLFYNGPFGESVWQLSDTWQSNAEAILDTDLQVALQTEINYYPDTDGLFLHAQADFLADVEGNYNLVHYLLRKSVVSAQSTTTGVDEDYVHHNVLTQAINGAWGDRIATGSITAGTSAYSEISFQIPSVDNTYAPSNLAVVSYVIERESFEILQVLIKDIE